MIRLSIFISPAPANSVPFQCIIAAAQGKSLSKISCLLSRRLVASSLEDQLPPLRILSRRYLLSLSKISTALGQLILLHDIQNLILFTIYSISIYILYSLQLKQYLYSWNSNYNCIGIGITIGIVFTEVISIVFTEVISNWNCIPFELYMTNIINLIYLTI